MIRRILAIGVVAVLAGCATDHFDRDKMASSGTTTGGMATAGNTGAAGSMCPAKIPNTTVQVRDTSNGVAMDFVTSGNVDDLRSSVHTMAQHEQQVASAGGTYGATPQGSSSGSTYGSNESYGSTSPDNGGQVRTSNPEGSASGSESGSAPSSGAQAKSGAEGGEGEECDPGTSGASGSSASGSASGSSAMNGSSGTGTYSNSGNCTSAGCGAFGVPVNAQVQDISGGSQLVLQPVDASQLDTLRQNAHQVGMMMQSGQCPPSSKPATGG